MAPKDSAVKERTITLTDAVVAIAMTLLVLPLVEAAPDVDTNDVAGFVSENWSLFLSFVVSFLVIYSFWVEHRQIFGGVAHPSNPFRLLNMLWLLAIAFVPFPTALIGREATTSTVPFYLGTVLALFVLTASMTLAAASSSGPERRAAYRHHGLRLCLGAAIVLICAVVSLWQPDLGLYGLLLLAALRFFDRKDELGREDV